MPHQCTECGRTFPDGSKEMLSGCPDCGGNKFQFKPSDAVDVGAGSGAAGGSDGGSGGGVGGRSSGDDGGGAMSRAKATVRDLMGRGSDDGSGGTGGESGAGQASISEYSNADASGSAASEAPASDARAGDAPAADSAATDATDSAATDATDSAATDATDSGTTGAGDSASSRDAADEDRVTPSGRSEWPKSGTEAYDTPAEQARRRDSSDESSGAASSPAGPAERESRPRQAVDEQASAGEQASTGDASATANASASAGESASADGSASAGEPEATDEDGSITAEMGETEDDAQRSARSDVVSPDELPNRESVAPGGVSEGGAPDAGSDRADRPPSTGAADVKDRPSAGDVASEPDDESPDLDELREELNSQFESIKVLDPGKYELNLMELYDREEYIISLQEDGRYVIEVPESWRGDASPD